MENKKFQFKTNINCSGCVTAIRPHLNNTENIKEWNVNTTHRDKILTIKVENITEKEIINIITKAGFKAEIL